MQTISDTTLLQQLKTEDNASFQLLYKFYFPSVSYYVRQNMGNAEDAEDVFQEAITVLLQKVRQPQFVLTASLKTYLGAIAKNIWLKRLRDNKIISVENFDRYQQETSTFFPELKCEKTREDKVSSWLAKITANCQRILKALFYHREPIESLMKKMGWKNRHVAANQQYKCIQQVKKERKKDEGA